MLGFATEIRQVISNLLINAIDSTPRGGKIIIHLYKSVHWANPNVGGYRLSIADTGSEISCLPFLFHRFAAAARARHGTKKGTSDASADGSVSFISLPGVCQ
jgi:signal transduction histidine kinase